MFCGGLKVKKQINIDINSVGKTNLIKTLHDPDFEMNQDYRETIESDYLKKTLIIKGEEYYLLMFDSSGNETFISFIFPILKIANLIVLVYDMTELRSFKKIEMY